jgi:hypothetical protein
MDGGTLAAPLLSLLTSGSQLPTEETPEPSRSLLLSGSQRWATCHWENTRFQVHQKYVPYEVRAVDSRRKYRCRWKPYNQRAHE